MTSTPAGDSANTLTVSQALAKLLRAYGAEYVFTLTGAPQDPLIEMQNHEGVRVVLGRSERSALAMADAYARVTGKPTFGIVQFGPGATYLPASIIDAFWASSPLIAISGTTTTKHALPLRVSGTRADFDVPFDDEVGGRPAAARAHCRRGAHRGARVRQRRAGPVVSRHPRGLVWQKTHHSAGHLCRARVSSHSRVESRAGRAGRRARHRPARERRKAGADCRRRRDPLRSVAGADRARRGAEHSRRDHDGRQRQHRRHASAGRRRVRPLFAQGGQRHARRRRFLPRDRHETELDGHQRISVSAAKARASCTSISIRIRSAARIAKSCPWSEIRAKH